MVSSLWAIVVGVVVTTQIVTVTVQIDPRYPWKPGQPPITQVIEQKLGDALHYVDGIEQVTVTLEPLFTTEETQP